MYCSVLSFMVTPSPTNIQHDRFICSAQIFSDPSGPAEESNIGTNLLATANSQREKK